MNASLLGFITVLSLLFLYYLATTLLQYKRRRRVSRKNGCQPVAHLPHKESFFGIGLLMKGYRDMQSKSYLEGTQARFSRYGNTHAAKTIGLNTIFTIEPENIETILARNFKDYSAGARRKSAFIPYLGHGIITIDGDAWTHSRRLLRPNFTFHPVNSLVTLERHTRNLIDAIPRDGSTVDLQQLFFHLSIDIASDFFCGESTLCLAPERRDSSSAKFSDVFAHFQCSIRNRLCLGKLAALVPDSKFRSDRDYLYSFVDDFVKNASVAKKSSGLDCNAAEKGMNSFTQFISRPAEQRRNRTQLREDVLHTFFAARDTTGSLLSNLWFILAKRSDIWVKLRREIDTLGQKKPTLDQLKTLSYLRSCIKESLRLHPPIPFNGRTSVRDTILPRGGGPNGRSPIFVPTGTTVDYNVYAMHRRQDVYGLDAAEFRPERWETLQAGWGYLPFSGGPRICLGQQLALTEVSYATVRLMQEFQTIESRDPQPWRECLTLTCSSANGTQVALMPTGENCEADMRDKEIWRGFL